MYSSVPVTYLVPRFTSFCKIVNNYTSACFPGRVIARTANGIRFLCGLHYRIGVTLFYVLEQIVPYAAIATYRLIVIKRAQCTCMCVV